MQFERLWQAYPDDYRPCKLPDGDPAFDNQCAIRLGLSLRDGGVNVSRYPGVRCWHGHNGQHFLRAQEMADWMKRNPSVFGKADIRSNVDASHYVGLRGIILCRNFWGTGNQGDHIDLWNKTFMATGEANYIARSEEVWFWEVDRSVTGEEFGTTEGSKPKATAKRKPTGTRKSPKRSPN